MMTIERLLEYHIFAININFFGKIFVHVFSQSLFQIVYWGFLFNNCFVIMITEIKWIITIWMFTTKYIWRTLWLCLWSQSICVLRHLTLICHEIILPDLLKWCYLQIFPLWVEFSVLQWTVLWSYEGFSNPKTIRFGITLFSRCTAIFRINLLPEIVSIVQANLGSHLWWWNYSSMSFSKCKLGRFLPFYDTCSKLVHVTFASIVRLNQFLLWRLSRCSVLTGMPLFIWSAIWRGADSRKVTRARILSTIVIFLVQRNDTTVA